MQDLHKALHHLQVVSGGEDEVQEDWGSPNNRISFRFYLNFPSSVKDSYGKCQICFENAIYNTLSLLILSGNNEI